MISLILVRWQGVVDFVVLTAALYILLRWAQQARALRVALVVLGLHAGALVSRHFDMVLTSLVLDGAAILAARPLRPRPSPKPRRPSPARSTGRDPEGSGCRGAFRAGYRADRAPR